MMNWNNNDTKYILKRIILYLILTGIVFFAGQSCAKAATYTSTFQYTNLDWSSSSEYNGTPLNGSNNFANTGSGYAVFTAYVTGNHPQLREAYINIGTASSSVQILCEMGTVSSFTDSTTQAIVYTFKCPANLGSSGIYSIGLRRAVNLANDGLYVRLSNYITYVSNESDANAINSAAATASQNEINAIQAQGEYDRVNADNNATRIINATNAATQQQINAINNQTDYLKEDYVFDSNLFTDVSGLLQQSDTDFIRTILLFPLTLYTIIGDVLTSGQCVQVNFGSLLGTNLYLPCINWKTYVGDTVYVAIDTIFSMVILAGFYTYVKNTIKALFTLGAEGYNQIDVEVFK